MKAQKLRTIIISKAALVDVQAALDKLRSGSGLSALESGTVEYSNIRGVDLVQGPILPVWNGAAWTVFLFVTSG